METNKAHRTRSTFSIRVLKLWYFSDVEQKMPPYLNKFEALEEFLENLSDSTDNLAEEVIRERIRVQKASLDQLVDLIKEREKAKQNNLASIESEMIKVHCALSLYKCIVYPIFPDNKRKGTLERALSELEVQRRQEQIDCWKDTLELWQELLKAASEYKATVRKAKILLFKEQD